MSSNQSNRSTIRKGIMSLLLPTGVGEGSGSLFSSHSNERLENFNKEAERPKILDVNQHKDFPKSLRADSDDVDDGSLPCTPQSDSDSDSWLAENEALTNDTRQLIGLFLAEHTGLRSARWNESKALRTMKRVVDSLLEKHRYIYNGMISKLQLDDKGDMGFIGDVAKSMFSDRTTNWGRITSLVAFGAVVAKHQKENGKKDCVELVAREISSYLLKEQRDWLIKNNAWDGFVEFFREADPESSVRNTLMTVVGVAGIGATLAMLIR